MSVVFFITTVVFFALFLGARADISKLRRENERLKIKLNEKLNSQPQKTDLKTDNESVKSEAFADNYEQTKSTNSPYNTSYMHQNQPVMSASFTADDAGSPQNTHPEPQTYETNNVVDTPEIENNAPIAEARQEKHRVSSINVLLIIGSLLIILAGFIFATTTWATLGNIVKAAIILSFSALLFAVHRSQKESLTCPEREKCSIHLAVHFCR